MTGRVDLRALTSARGIAAWLVVLYHLRLSIAGLPPTIVAWLAKGYLAVDFFFLLSGFVIWLSWHERFHARGWRVAGEFVQRRVARIWPLHLFMLGFAVMLAALLALTGRALPGEFVVAELPLHVVLVHNWGFTADLGWNVPSWSISTEAAAYLLFVPLCLLVDWRRWPSWLLFGVIVLLGICLWRFFAALGHPTLGQDIAHTGLVRCLVEFVIGTLVGALWHRWHAASRHVLWPAIMLGFAAVIALPEPLGVPLGFAALLLALALSAGGAGHPLEGRVLHFLGEISYATYLGHALIWIAFKLALVRDASHVPPVQIGLYLVLLLAGSILLYRCVELPAQRAINRVRWRRQQRQGSATVP
ncbi:MULTISPECIES: acyltransferase family protein [unclassified Sphingomonas]|jgi:peptidoglycan/LPS O-acetylase OafA/YrhL|uniref:acyltransferase family protein n=1 Tax=unclassified Sphingomonas TaxID=196159 RepID=UPI000829C407|nr:MULTISPECIES: acyltransferase [unclassified Sphingomonas]